jgi:parvulin-like peptidyl-prolyl isomerase
MAIPRAITAIAFALSALFALTEPQTSIPATDARGLTAGLRLMKTAIDAVAMEQAGPDPGEMASIAFASFG